MSSVSAWSTRSRAASGASDAAPSVRLRADVAMPVCTAPGHNAVTPIGAPAPASSPARHSVSASPANFDVVYAAEYADGKSPGGRDRVHDVTRPTALDHPGHERLDAVQDPVEVHAHHPGEVGDGLGPERAAGEDARVVAQQVGAAELARRPRAASARTDAASATSVSTAIASTPVSAHERDASPPAAPASMSAAATRMPSTAQATANARPMPLAGARDRPPSRPGAAPCLGP